MMERKIRNKQALREAWAWACAGTGKQATVIPKGAYLVGTPVRAS
jgi:hypothetical protein